MGSEIIQAKIEINTLANSILKIPKLPETSVASQTLPKINFRKLFLRKKGNDWLYKKTIRVNKSKIVNNVKI